VALYNLLFNCKIGKKMKIKTFVCSNCGKIYYLVSGSSSYKTHKSFKCEECGNLVNYRKIKIENKKK